MDDSQVNYFCQNGQQRELEAKEDAITAGEMRMRIAELSAKIVQLEVALRLAINTVECASIDVKTGEELPWYRAARKALAVAAVESLDRKAK